MMTKEKRDSPIQSLAVEGMAVILQGLQSQVENLDLCTMAERDMTVDKTIQHMVRMSIGWEGVGAQCFVRMNAVD